MKHNIYETNFTQGKWTIDSMPLPARKVIVIRGEYHKGVIAEVKQLVNGKIYTEKDDIEASANANLIAAAPDLYDALKYLVECVQDEKTWKSVSDTEKYPRGLVATVKQALAKAEGITETVTA